MHMYNLKLYLNPGGRPWNQFMLLLQFCRPNLSNEEYSSSVKIINPNDKGGYRVEQLQTKYPKLTTVEHIRSELTEQLKVFVDGASCEFGYLFPGHGLKGGSLKMMRILLQCMLTIKEKESLHCG